MFQKIFFVSLQMLNFIGVNVALIYAMIKWFPQKAQNIGANKNEKEEGFAKYKLYTFQNQTLKLVLWLLPFLILSIIAYAFNGFYKVPFLFIPICVSGFGSVLFFHAFTIYFYKIQKKCKIEFVGSSTFSANATVGCVMGMFYSIPLGLTAHTVALLFV